MSDHAKALIGFMLIGGAMLLPVDPASVEHHTTERLMRKGLKSLKGDKGPTMVQLSKNARQYEKLITEKNAKNKKGDRVPTFVVASRNPVMDLKSEVKDGQLVVTGKLAKKKFEKKARMGDALSLLPPLIALVLAVAYRKVLLALFMAVFMGAVVMNGFNPFKALWVELRSLLGVGYGLLGGKAIPVDGYFGRVLSDSFNLKILAFTFALVGLVAVVGKMGGTKGLVVSLGRFVKGPRSAQAATGVMGTAIFFDDYANTVVVGTTARSLTDRMRISREKLAYIVDSTSAPVAGVAIISTWIGYEVGLFEDLIPTIGAVSGIPGSGYELFFAIMPLRFYCWFALMLVFLGAIMGRDMGPMLAAERRVRAGGPLVPVGFAVKDMDSVEKEGVKPLARNAIIPIGLVLLLMVGLILDVGTRGMAEFSLFSLKDWRVVFEKASDEVPLILLLSSLVGGGLAIFMAMQQKLLTFKEATTAWFGGITTLFEAAGILILAWSIKAVCDDLGTGMAMVAIVGDSLPAVALPFIIFLLSGAVAFATGTSWGTMALVLPVAAPLSATISGDAIIVLASMGAVLDGAIWGDHCSPISDTTVLSSTACGCPHLEHVRTQLPYATLAMTAAGLLGYLAYALGLPIVICYLGGIGMLIGGLFVFGRSPEVAAA